MDKGLFDSIFKCFLLRDLVFRNVRLIHSTLYRFQNKGYGWEDVERFPHLMVGNHYFQLLKDYYNKRMKKIGKDTWAVQDNVKIFSMTRRSIETAIAVNRLDIFKYFFETLKVDVDFNIVTRHAMRYGRLEFVQYLDELAAKSKHRSINYRGICMDAAIGHNVDMLEWIAKVPQLCNGPDVALLGRLFKSAAECAAGHGRLGVIQRMVARGHISLTDKELFGVLAKVAASSGQTDIIKWFICQKVRVPVHVPLIDSAAIFGYLDIVQLLHENWMGSCSTNAMDGAASNGHLEILVWLHTNREEGCTTSAMDNAARNGHFEIVKWLHIHRFEGCTSLAMDNAAMHSLEFVQFFHFSRKEGCTYRAMDNAVFKGHLDTVKWLHENRTEGCSTYVLDQAAAHSKELLQWLVENRQVKGNAFQMMHIAALAGKLENIKYMHSINLKNDSEYCFINTLFCLMNQNEMEDNFEMIKYLVENHPIYHETFPERENQQETILKKLKLQILKENPNNKILPYVFQSNQSTQFFRKIADRRGELIQFAQQHKCVISVEFLKTLPSPQ